jgi:hypothetical protein
VEVIMTTGLTVYPTRTRSRKHGARPSRAAAAAQWTLAFVIAASVTASGLSARVGAEPPGEVGTAPAERVSVGAYTGEFAGGLAVYRLPPVTVVASRKAELARMAREERVLAAGNTRTDAALAGRGDRDGSTAGARSARTL